MVLTDRKTFFWGSKKRRNRQKDTDLISVDAWVVGYIHKEIISAAAVASPLSSQPYTGKRRRKWKEIY